MLVCPKCNNEQESGKFCGVCGTAVEPSVAENNNQNESVESETETLGTPPVQQQAQPEAENVTVNQAAAATAAQQTQTQASMDNVKEGLGNYWSYFVHIIKNPSRAFQYNENQFINGLVTLGLYAIIFSFSLYFLANSLMNVFGGGLMSDSLPFFSIVSRLIFFIIVLFAISFGSAFLMVKAGKNQDGFKKIIAQYGALIVPFTAINVLAFVGGLIGSVQLTLISIITSLIFTFIFVPVVFVYEKVSESNPQGQKIYLSLATVLIISIVSFLLGDALLMNVVEQMEYMFRFF